VGSAGILARGVTAVEAGRAPTIHRGTPRGVPGPGAGGWPRAIGLAAAGRWGATLESGDARVLAEGPVIIGLDARYLTTDPDYFAKVTARAGARRSWHGKQEHAGVGPRPARGVRRLAV